MLQFPIIVVVVVFVVVVVAAIMRVLCFSDNITKVCLPLPFIIRVQFDTFACPAV